MPLPNFPGGKPVYAHFPQKYSGQIYEVIYRHPAKPVFPEYFHRPARGGMSPRSDTNKANTAKFARANIRNILPAYNKLPVWSSVTPRFQDNLKKRENG